MYKYCLAFFLLIFSCKNPTEKRMINSFSEDDLPEKKVLVGQRLNLPFLENPRGLLVNDEFIVVSQSRLDTLINVYNKESGLLIKKIAPNGLGPGEITYVRSMEFSGDKTIWVYDSQYKAFHQFNLKDDTALATNSFNKNEAFFFIAEMAISSESSVWSVMLDKQTQYFELGFNGDTLSSFGNWSKYDDRKDFPASTISSMHQGKMIVNKEKRVGVRAGVMRDYIDIVNLDNKEVYTLFGPSNHFPKYDAEYSQGYPMPDVDFEDARTHYIDLQAGKNSIYLLYFGGKMQEFGNNEIKNRIIEIDYSGNLKNVFELDTPILSFSIDEKNKVFYCIRFDNEPNVITFKY
jgi:hypothetical protein